MRRLLPFLLVVSFTGISFLSEAQCAMCRTQVVNNVSHGETTFAAGLNLGIMYLFFTPYVVAGIIAFLWFKNSKTNGGKRTLASFAKR